MSNQYRSVLAGAGGTGGDALVSEVLTGKTFTNDNGPQTGTMTNNGAVTETLTYDQEYTIPAGYHNGSGKVTAPSKSKLTLSSLLWETHGLNTTYTHNSANGSEALLITSGATGTLTVTGSSGVIATSIGTVTYGYIVLHTYKLSGLENGSTVNIVWSGGSGDPSVGIFKSENVNYL